MKAEYKPVTEFIGWGRQEIILRELIISNKLRSVLEIGAGANPTMPPEFIKQNNLEYVISDIDVTELNKADDVYNKEVLDLSKAINISEKKYDLIFSRMVGEHISDGSTFHKNVYNLLNKNGISFHCYSTLYAMPFLANKFLPAFISNLILKKIAPRDDIQHAKFNAYYSWCRGPSKSMIKKFEKTGFEVIEYVGYFGHFYYNKFAPLQFLENLKTRALIKLKLPFFTSYAHVLLRKTS